MSKPDRVSIDIAGLREKIESCRQDPFWQELSLSKKIRVLIQEALEAQEKDEETRELSE